MPRKPRSFLTTTSSSSSVVKGKSKEDAEGGDASRMKRGNEKSPSVFQSPSLEERLATMGIDLGRTRSGSEINISAAARRVLVDGDGDDASSNFSLSARSSAQSVNSTGSHSMSPRSFGGGGSGLSGRRLDEVESGDVSERKSARLSKDINRRISEISMSMDQYDKSVRNVNETMQEAYRKTVQDQKRNRQGGSALGSMNSSPRILGEEIGDSSEAFLLKCRESLTKSILAGVGGVDGAQLYYVGGAGDSNAASNNQLDLLYVGRESPRKVFGLDATSLLKSSSSEASTSEEDEVGPNLHEDVDKLTSGTESSSEEEDGAAAMRVSIQSQKRPSKAATLKRLEEIAKNASGRSARSKVKRKKNRKSLTRQMEDFVPRSLSPIMPSLPDKQFQTMLERREERVTRHLNSMKNGLAQLNHKVEMDKRRAEGGDNKKDSSNSGRGGSGSARGNMQHSYKGRPLRLMKAQPDKGLSNEFNEFMQSTGGKAGGWEGNDHNVFLKTFEIWRSHPKRLLEALKKDFPHKRVTELAAHVKWYERFLELDSQNKANVHKWSQKKRKENELVFQMSSASNKAKLEGDKRRQEHLQRIREQEREKNREKLALWKRSQYVRSTPSADSPEPDIEHSKAIPFHQRPRPRSTSSSNVHLLNQESTKHTRSGSTPSKAQSGQDPSGKFDIAGVRQHILEITAKVHALDNPKREFRPPPLPVLASKLSGKRGKSVEDFHTPDPSAEIIEEGSPVSRKLSQFRIPSVSVSVSMKSSNENGNGMIGPRSIQKSSSAEATKEGKSQSRKLSELREKDGRLVEAKKKAIQIARERRKTNLSQISAEEIRRRVRSQTSSPSTILNPTRQSELRNSLTHLKRLEMLSQEDLKRGGVAPPPTIGFPQPEFQRQGPPIGSTPFPPNISIGTVTKKSIPSWRLLDNAEAILKSES